MSFKQELAWAKNYFSTANYISAASIYLRDNFLLKRKLEANDIKDSLLGHWGTCPGINFIYTHLNLIASKNNQEILLVNGPGHGFGAVLANLFIEGSLSEFYPRFKNNEQGLGKLIKSFCWPKGFPSHINPQVPGTIHEGGELGYALGTAFGAAFDNPNLIVAAVIGDGECETGPTATAWHSNKFLNPKKDGAVLPIIHLNRYKIHNPTIYSTMKKDNLKKLFEGHGYQIKFVGKSHKQMMKTLEWAYKEIKKIQNDAKKNKLKDNPAWPMIVLDTPKGWTDPKEYHGKKLEGSFRSHQVPLPNVKKDKIELELLESWLKSYSPEKILPDGKIPQKTFKFVPQKNLRIGMNKHARAGDLIKNLNLPKENKFEVKVSNKNRGEINSSSMKVFSKYLEDVFRKNKNNFRIFSPDELKSNKLDSVLKITKKRYFWNIPEIDKKDCKISKDGMVMEMLSEHTLQSWMQGYVLTGRHAIFPSYEAFLPIVDSMVSQYLKFVEVAEDIPFRKPISSLNYVLSSVCWRQDHNGFSHQNPGFIDTLLSKENSGKLVRIFFPADTNTLLATTKEIFNSKEKVNALVAAKRDIRQWLTLNEAKRQVKVGAGVWDFASDNNPEIVLASCGDYQTQEMLAARNLIKKEFPKLKLRFVNVNELNVLGDKKIYSRGLSQEKFEQIFTKDKPVIFSFHGYPSSIKQLLFDRRNNSRFKINGYDEVGTTTTPFQMLVLNKISRYNVVMELIEILKNNNKEVSKKAKEVTKKMQEKIKNHEKYIVKNGRDSEEINSWKFE